MANNSKVMGFGGGFAKGFADGMAKNLNKWAQDEDDAAAVAAARYEENRKSFFEKNKEDEEKIKQAEAMIEQLYPKAADSDKRARTTDAVELLRAGYTIDKTLDLMQDRVYKEIVEDEEKVETEVKPETTESTDINAQTDELITTTNEALTENDETVDLSEPKVNGDGSVYNADTETFESDDEKDITSQTNELITDVKATLNETSEVSTEEDDKEEKPGLFERMRTSSADRRTGRINRRVDELTGTDVDTRKKMADGFLPTDYVRIDGEGRAEFNLKVDKEDELSGWDYYRLNLQDNEHFQQMDNLGKAQWLVQAEGEYKAIEGGKNYAKGTYLAELNREELLEKKILETPEKYDEKTIANNRFMLDIILPMRKSNLDILGDDDSSSSGKNDKNLVSYQLRIEVPSSVEGGEVTFKRRSGLSTSIFVDEAFIAAYPEYADKAGQRVNVYKMPNPTYGVNNNSAYLPHGHESINNAEGDKFAEERRDLWSNIQSKDLSKTIVDGRAGVVTALRSAYEIDQMVYQQPDVLLAGGSMETFFAELGKDISSIVGLVTGNHGEGTKISRQQALADLDSYYTTEFGSLGQLSETAKTHRLFTMRMIKFAYASARIDGNYGQGLSDNDLKLTFQSITGAKDYETFSKNLKMIVGQSVNELNENIRQWGLDSNIQEFQELGGKVNLKSVKDDAQEGGWGDAYGWSQMSVEDWVKQNPLTRTGEVIDLPPGITILTDMPNVALNQILIENLRERGFIVEDKYLNSPNFRILSDNTIVGY
jgi:hypothetical protein